LKLINGIVAVALLVTLLENRQPYLAVSGLALLLLWSFSLRLSKGLGFRRLEWAIVVCLAYWVASYFWSVRDFNNFISVDFFRRDGSLLVSYTAFIGLLGWPLKPAQCWKFWTAFLWLLTLIAIPGIVYCVHLFPYPDVLERIGIVSFDSSLGARLLMGWWEAHNSAGGVYALGSILALTFLQNPQLRPKSKQLVRVIFLCCLGGLLFTFSRGGYLGFLAGAAYVLPLRKLGTTVKACLLVGIPLLLLGLMTSSLFSRIDSITDPYYGTNADRFRIWGEALDDIESSPIIGIGYSRFNDNAVEFKGVKGLYWVGVAGRIVNDDSHAHNSYLHFWAEGGIVGLWLTLRIWWYAWAELCFFESKLPKSKLRGLHRASKACLLGLLVLSLTEHLLGKGSVPLVAMSLIGMTLAASRWEWRTLQEAQKRVRSSVHVPPQMARERQLAAPAR
jgi:O-antigen ligase